MKNLNSLISNVESNQPTRIETFFNRSVAPTNKIVKTALIESFEKKEIGLTADYIATIIKNQVEKLLFKLERCNNLEVTWFDKCLKEWINLLLQIRGDINKEKEGNKVLLAQQFVEKNQEYDKIITHLLTKN